jgi:molybdenum cofactor cytidylyltransferase
MPGASEPPEGRTAGIVLAAGASTRMGPTVNKLLLQVDGEPMIRRVVRQALEAGLAPVVVVVGHESARIREALAGLAVTFAANADFTGPTSGSLHAGLRALGDDVARAVVVLGDMVRVDAVMIRALIVAAGASGGAPLVVSRYGIDAVLAPPLLFDRALWPELLAWHGEGCGKAVVKAHLAEASLLDWPSYRLADIDTPADYTSVVGTVSR